METKTERWTLRVTAAQDTAVRRVLEATGESLNEYVVRHAVQAAHADLADRRVFAIDDAAWTEFQALLDRPPQFRPALAKLLADPSILEPKNR
ncbi:MAG: type II toxin-antitoxin system TacA family antitoxin [Actinomycetota bacterium]